MSLERTRFSTTFTAGIPTVKVTGELDHCSSNQCRSIFAEVAKKGQSKAIIDLSELDYLDSSGLSAIIFSAKQFSEMGGCLVIIEGNPTITRKFVIGGLIALPNLVVKCNSLEEALEYLEKNQGD